MKSEITRRMKTKSISVLTLASLVHGRMLVGTFSLLQEASEWLLGHPIWTHEFADKANILAIKGAIYAQHPDLQAIEEIEITGENWKAKADEIEMRFGKFRECSKGIWQRTESPTESAQRMFPGKPVIEV